MGCFQIHGWSRILCDTCSAYLLPWNIYKGKNDKHFKPIIWHILAAKLHENEKKWQCWLWAILFTYISGRRGGARRRGEKGTARQTLNSGGSRLSHKSSPTTKMGVKSYYLANYFSKTAWKWKKFGREGGPSLVPLWIRQLILTDWETIRKETQWGGNIWYE